MDITVVQIGVTYFYECTENCDICPARFLCYTHETDGERHMTYNGFPYLDLVLMQSRLAGTLTFKDPPWEDTGTDPPPWEIAQERA